MNRERQTRLDGLIYANIFGALTPEERDELYEAAKDPDVFAKLMETEDLRSAMESPELRQSVRAALRPAPRLQPVPSRKWNPWWTLVWAVAGAAAVLLCVVLLQRPSSTDREVAVATPEHARPPRAPEGQPSSSTRPAQPDLQPAINLAPGPLTPVFGLDAQQSLAAQVAWADGQTVPHVHVGELLRIRIACPQRCTAWAFVLDPNGSARLLTSQQGITVSEGEPVILTDGSGGAPLAASIPGDSTVRVVAVERSTTLFPDGVLDVRGISGPAAVIDLHLVVDGG